MLAADRSLLEINLKQSAIKLREKELNLYSNNYEAMATTAAVFSGFTTTCLIELEIPIDTSIYAIYFLHLSAIISICSSVTCVSLATITSIWGSGKALRGKDGSMDEAVDGMNSERPMIFRSFALGLAGNLSTVCAMCIIMMEYPISIIAVLIVLYTCFTIASHAIRIQKRFMLTETVRLDDLTQFRNYDDYQESSGTYKRHGSDTNDSNMANARYRKSSNSVENL